MYERSDEVNRLQKVLETANIKLSCVATDVLGKSGRAMIAGLIGGESSAEELADLARGRLKKKLPELREALLERRDDHHRILLIHILAHIEFLEGALEQLYVQIQPYLAPYEEAVELLISIPGLGQESAASILGEIGVATPCFPSAAHLASWAGLCPGNRQSGGKRLSGKTNKGNARLRVTLAEVVWVLSHMKDNYLSAQYHRFARRIGKKKAVIVVSHSIIVIIYHLLRNKEPYSDLGATYFETLDKERIEKAAVRRLQGLGYKVTLQPQEEVSA